MTAPFQIKLNKEFAEKAVSMCQFSSYNFNSLCYSIFPELADYQFERKKDKRLCRRHSHKFLVSFIEKKT